MKGKLLIVFYSKYGYTKRYVDILGNAIGCDAVPSDAFKPNMLAGYDKILYIGSVRGGAISGFAKFSDCLGAIYKKLIVCGVGLSPFRKHIPMRIKELSVSVSYEKFVPVFYVQGGFDFNELGKLDRMQAAMRVRQIKSSEFLSDEDKDFINAVDKPIDEVKLANIQPLIDFIEGRAVDTSLYSAPEITDAEEEKKFFDEMEEAAKAPDDKKRALKKKLKK